MLIDKDAYLIWSNEHRAWWRANSRGYARDIRNAGLYSRDEAVSIAAHGRFGWDFDRAPDEIAVALADIPPQVAAAINEQEPR